MSPPDKVELVSSHKRGKRTVHPSLIRPVLFGGTEQGMAMLTVIAGVGVPLYGGFHPVSLVVGLALAFPTHTLGVWLAKKDAQMVTLFVRSLLDRDFYLPYGSRRTRSPVVRPSIPGAR
jgi:type IV secretory pathway TrbD component